MTRNRHQDLPGPVVYPVSSISHGILHQTVSITIPGPIILQIRDVLSSHSQARATTADVASAARSSACDYYSQRNQEVGAAASSRPSSSGDDPITSALMSPSRHVTATLSVVHLLWLPPSVVLVRQCMKAVDPVLGPTLVVLIYVPETARSFV